MSGITYYKLSKDIYPGDTTKGCGLTGPEIDANFHFLRGYDIKDGELNPDNGIITLYRLNGEEIKIDGLAELLSGLTDFNLDESYYDPSEGVLHLFVNGEEQSAITGFFTHADIHVDCTLEGDGSEENRLRISKEFINGVHNEVKDAVDKERGEREEADKNLNDKISDEIERAKSAESGLTQEIATEKQRATEAEGNLQHEIESEKSRATEKENELDDKINNVEEDLQTAVSSLTNEIASAVTDLKEDIDAERNERESAVTDLTQAISDAKEELYSAITEEKSEREGQIEEIKEDIAGLDSAFTESLSEINSEISAITDSISELEEKVADVTLTEDIVISENSPLYPFISGIWPDNIIKDGTTFTDFVKALCSEDMRKVYYISTDKRLSYYIDDDRRVRRISDFHETETALALSSGFTIDIEEGSLNCIILLPFGRDLISVKTNEGGEPYIQDLFENKGICLVSESNSLNNKYNVYAYKTIESSASSNEEFYVRIV